MEARVRSVTEAGDHRLFILEITEAATRLPKTEEGRLATEPSLLCLEHSSSPAPGRFLRYSSTFTYSTSPSLKDLPRYSTRLATMGPKRCSVWAHFPSSTRKRYCWGAAFVLCFIGISRSAPHRDRTPPCRTHRRETAARRLACGGRPELSQAAQLALHHAPHDLAVNALENAVALDKGQIGEFIIGKQTLDERLGLGIAQPRLGDNRPEAMVVQILHTDHTHARHQIEKGQILTNLGDMTL